MGFGNLKRKNIMTEWHPQVVAIESVTNHPNADNLSIVKVLGDYTVVTKKNEYQVGDIAAYIPVDSIVPDVPAYHFLSPKEYEKYEENGEIKQRVSGPKYPVGSVPEKYRIIKAKSIRNICSTGMLVPVPEGLYLGDSVETALALKKWEEEVDDNIPSAKIKGRNAASPPKGWSIPHYDIEGLRKYISCLGPEEEIVLLEKLNGSNFSAAHDGEKLWVKSRNFYKKYDLDDSWVEVAHRYDLDNKLKKYPMLAFFAELYGLVKGYRYDLEVINGKVHSKLGFFDIYDLNNGRYLDYDDTIKIFKDLDLPAVPELYRGKWLGKEEMYPYAEGPTILGGKHIREGFVMKTIKERFEPRLHSRMQVKLVGEGYLLKK